MALLRDVPFLEYNTTPWHRPRPPSVGLTDFRGPKSGGQVTTGTLFRGASKMTWPGRISSSVAAGPLWGAGHRPRQRTDCRHV
jgi:hypothetical protein